MKDKSISKKERCSHNKDMVKVTIVYFGMNTPTELSRKFPYIIEFKLTKCPEIQIK